MSTASEIESIEDFKNELLLHLQNRTILSKSLETLTAVRQKELADIADEINRELDDEQKKEVRHARIHHQPRTIWMMQPQKTRMVKKQWKWEEKGGNIRVIDTGTLDWLTKVAVEGLRSREPKTTTLDLISIYLGYTDWADFRWKRNNRLTNGLRDEDATQHFRQLESAVRDISKEFEDFAMDMFDKVSHLKAKIEHLNSVIGEQNAG